MLSLMICELFEGIWISSYSFRLRAMCALCPDEWGFLVKILPASRQTQGKTRGRTVTAAWKDVESDKLCGSFFDFFLNLGKDDPSCLTPLGRL